jgi:hypothetical protein
MATLADMMNDAHGGRAMDLLARQFDISRQQAELAVEALLPAFSQGLKRNAADPYGLSAFLQAMSTGQHAKYFEDASRAFDPAGIAEGNGILGHLFGSKELSRAVAAQAAQATGLGQDLLKQMLPVLASMIMGGLFKQSTGQMGSGQMGGSAGQNPLTEIMEQMMRQGGGMQMPRPEAPQPGMNPFDNPFGKALEGMFGGNRETSARQPQTPFDNPLGQIFEEMMGSGRTKAQPKKNPSGRARTPYDDLFGGMFETGAKTRDDYQKGMESVFDRFLEGMEKHGR